jgi:hypothetical protein
MTNNKFYTIDGQSANLKKPVRRKDGKWELNPTKLTAEKLANELGVFTYLVPEQQEGKQSGKLIFDAKKGTCTRELVAIPEPTPVDEFTEMDLNLSELVKEAIIADTVAEMRGEPVKCLKDLKNKYIYVKNKTL